MASRLCFLLLVIFCSSYASLVSNRKDAVENKRLSLPLDFLLRNQSRRASFSGICSNNGPVKMGSKNGYRLSILDDGTVEGVHDSDGSQNGEYTVGVHVKHIDPHPSRHQGPIFKKIIRQITTVAPFILYWVTFTICRKIFGKTGSRPQTYEGYSVLHTQHSIYVNGGILSVECESWV